MKAADKTKRKFTIQTIQFIASFLLFVSSSTLIGCGGAPVVTSNATSSENATPSGVFEITDIKVTSITESSLTVTWKTGVPATSLAIAHEQNSVNSFASFPDDAMVTSHKAVIDFLSSSNPYEIEVKSKNAGGQELTKKLDGSFKLLFVRAHTDLKAGDTAPQFALNSLDGKSHRLSDYSGKTVMLIFWMTTCNACKTELPLINSFWNSSKYKDLVLLTIDVGEDKAVTKAYIEGHKYSFTVLSDPEKDVDQQYTVAHYPTTFLIGPTGKITRIQEDPFKNEAEMADFVSSNQQ